MPGKRITDLQVNKYKALRGEHSQEAAAAKTGISHLITHKSPEREASVIKADEKACKLAG